MRSLKDRAIDAYYKGLIIDADGRIHFTPKVTAGRNEKIEQFIRSRVITEDPFFTDSEPDGIIEFKIRSGKTATATFIATCYGELGPVGIVYLKNCHKDCFLYRASQVDGDNEDEFRELEIIFIEGCGHKNYAFAEMLGEGMLDSEIERALSYETEN